MYIEGDYNDYIVALSVVIAILASYSALSIAGKISSSRGKTRFFWLLAGALVMGNGVWSMHFVGMLAFHPHATVQFDVWLTLLSLAASVITALIAFYITMPKNVNRYNIVIGGLFMGCGIVTMHYVGMKAMIMQVGISYDKTVLALSAVIAFIASYGALFLFLRFRDQAMYFDRHVLEKMAYQDTITGLPNRNEMNRFFDTHTGNETLGVLFLDLDQFKSINDTLGHHVGDLLVQEVGVRLRQFVNEDQQAFRIGGDEFLFILKHGDLRQAEELAAQVLQSIKKVYRIHDNELYVTGSIGISIGKIQDSDRSVLLKTADTAMYKAKGQGKNQYCVYSEEMGVQEVRKMELEKDLQRALEKNQFFVEYQPKWNVTTKQLVGFEALIRWQHPRLGVVAPREFISIAEETGFIIPMTRWTLQEACRQCKIWQSQGIVQPVSVNLSVRLFQTDCLTEMISCVLNEAGLEARLLELEITESMVFFDINDIIRQLQIIRELGVRVSMDDFGTGYSSIGLLDRLPIDALKLDRLFTNDLDTPSKRAVIHAIILMAESLHLDVIAEGVESQKHINLLTRLGCHVMQGYYYGKPMRSELIEKWLETNAQ